VRCLTARGKIAGLEGGKRGLRPQTGGFFKQVMHQQFIFENDLIFLLVNGFGEINPGLKLEFFCFPSMRNSPPRSNRSILMTFSKSYLQDVIQIHCAV